MKRIFFSIIILAFFSTTGCKKFSDFQTDPNNPSVASPELLLNTVAQQALPSIDLQGALAMRYLAISQNTNAYQYYTWARGDYSIYNQLRQVLKMEQAAQAQNKPQYIPIGKFYRAWCFLRLTNLYGDIPYSEALKGEEGGNAPVYDRQEDIFLAILDDLKAANDLITATTPSVQGDILYSGNMQQWKRAINSLALRTLMSLSAKVNDARFQVAQRFAAIVNNPVQYPVMTGNADNIQLKFYDLANNRYTLFGNPNVQNTYSMEGNFVELLKTYKDPRLFSFADKATKYASLPATDFNAYGGINASDPVNVNASKVLAGEASRINPRYYNSAVNEPAIGLGYAELQFILAEGVVRGWIGGTADTYYKKGIAASMSFYNIDQTTTNTYAAQSSIQLTTANSIEMIQNQKYIASFMNSDWNIFYESRRTGFPVMDTKGAGAVNNKKVPTRFLYPQAELQYNQKNVTDAISRQFPGGDDINAILWINKP
ncbi:MAG: SusD/RagB family nutrient-binding outer membrane lipoprotein [Chitinophagaceae bacterium]